MEAGVGLYFDKLKLYHYVKEGRDGDLNASVSEKSEETSENVKRAASGCVSVTLETAKPSHTITG